MASRSNPIRVSEADKKELLTWSRSGTMQRRYVDRSRIILLSADGATFSQIRSAVGVTEAVINKWRQRFRREGLAGLRDQPRCGAPITISAEQKARVIELATSKPDDGHTSWSQARIAKAVGISQSKVHQLLKQADVRPHKIEYWCGKSTDPEFEQKMTAIIGLYLNPPQNALILCVDEKTGIQALDRSQPELPLTTGRPKRLTNTYKRNGTVSLMAALAVHSGQITGQMVERNNAENFLKFLKKLDRKYRHKKLHIIVDNLATHKQRDVMEWIESKKKKIQIHYTPTYSSWLNQIEIWFSILTRDVLKGGVWTSKQQLVDQLIRYIKTYNNTKAKPFQWTYTGNPLTI